MLKSSLFYCDPNLSPLLPHPNRSGWRRNSLSIPRNAAGMEPVAALTYYLHFFSLIFFFIFESLNLNLISLEFESQAQQLFSLSEGSLRGSLLCKNHVTDIKSVITDKIRLCWARGLSLNQTGVRQGWCYWNRLKIKL